jgi:hypothetical protein
MGTTPANGATGVNWNQVIQIVFNRAVEASDATEANFQLVPEVPTLQVYVDPTNPAQVDMDPKGSNLAPGVTYTVTIPTPGIQDEYGNNLTTPYTFSFTTQSNAPPPPPTPNVTSVTPGSGQTGIAVNTDIVAVMNTPVVSGGVTSSNVLLYEAQTGSTVPASVSLASDNETITVDPTSNLLYSTLYYLVVQNLQNLASVTQSPNPYNPFGTGSYTSVYDVVQDTNVNSACTAGFVQVYNVAQDTNTDSSCPSGGGGTTFTSIYNVAQDSTNNSTCDAGDGWMCPIYHDQPNGYYGFGEIASSSNGLTAGAITRVVIKAVACASGGTASGTIGIVIVSSGGTVRYTFATTASISLNNSTESNVTITDTGNTYTMVAGDAIIATWSGTPESNELFLSSSGSAGYGKSCFYAGGDPITGDSTSGFDFAAQFYTGTAGATPGAGYACWVDDTSTDNYAYGETANSANGLIGAVITKVVIANVKTYAGTSGTVGIKIVKANGTTQYTFASTQSVSSSTGTSVTLTDTGNTYALTSGDGVFVTWNQPNTNGLAISDSTSSGFSTHGGAFYNGSTITSDSPRDLAIIMYESTVAPGAGYACYIDNTGTDNYAYGETANSANGLINQVITKVVIANVKTYAGTSGTVGIVIVKANGSIAYTFASTQSVSSSTGVSVTLVDDNNPYALQNGDGVFVTWNQGNTNGLAISDSTSSGFSTNGAAEYNGTITSDSPRDMAAQMYVAAAAANAFTTTASSFIQEYSVSQNSNPCTGKEAGFGPTNKNCGSGNSLGTNSDDAGTAYGEKASVANGLTAAPITKVVIAMVGADDDDFSNSTCTQPTAGLIGVKIVNSSGTLKYTFASTFNTATATGFGTLCTASSCNGAAQTLSGWTNVTLEDTGNTYTMAVGDIILITWSGTGGNVACVSQNTSGPYGAAYYENSSGSLANVNGCDIAMTCYSG